MYVVIDGFKFKHTYMNMVHTPSKILCQIYSHSDIAFMFSDAYLWAKCSKWLKLHLA